VTLGPLLPPVVRAVGPGAATSVLVLADVPPGRGRSPAYGVGQVVGFAGAAALFGWLIVRGVRRRVAARERAAKERPPPPPR